MKNYIINAIILDKNEEEEELKNIILNTYIQAASDAEALSYLNKIYNVIEVISVKED